MKNYYEIKYKERICITIVDDGRRFKINSMEFV